MNFISEEYCMHCRNADDVLPCNHPHCNKEEDVCMICEYCCHKNIYCPDCNKISNCGNCQEYSEDTVSLCNDCNKETCRLYKYDLDVKTLCLYCFEKRQYEDEEED